MRSCARVRGRWDLGCDPIALLEVQGYVPGDAEILIQTMDVKGVLRQVGVGPNGSGSLTYRLAQNRSVDFRPQLG